MNEALIPIIKTSPNFDLWLAIGENRIADALDLLAVEKAAVNRRWWKFWQEIPVLDAVRRYAYLFLFGAPNEVLSMPPVSLETFDKVFPEWIRFCSSVQYSGHFSEQLPGLLEQTVDKLKELADEVAKKSNGYPRNSMKGVWFSGACMREWAEVLASLFEMRVKPHSKAIVLQLKCKITCSIMSHYQHLVGPDMIDAAAALVAIDELDTAHEYYKAVIIDFEPLVHQADEPIPELDLISLKALLAAYDGFGQLSKTDVYQPARQHLEQLLRNAAAHG